jgi:hypothetical protein
VSEKSPQKALSKLQEELKKIDFKQAEVIIGALLNIRVAFVITVSKCGKISIESDLNYTSACGILSRSFKDVRIVNFGGGFICDGEKFWFPVSFQYELTKGGSNCVKFCELEWDTKLKRWDILN